MNDIKRSLPIQRWSRDGGVVCIGVLLIVSLFSIPEVWAITATPTALSFQAVEGSTSPSSQTLNVLKSNSKTVTWTSSDSASWLSVSPTSGSITNSAQLLVNVNPSGLTAGTYTGTVTVVVTKGGSISVPVTFTVTLPPTTNSGTTVSLSWNPSTSTNVVGYKIYMGTTSGVYSSSSSVGNVTTFTVTNLAFGTTYYFAVTDYDTNGLESDFSNEVSKTLY
jgi:hypothetical protein